MQSSLNTGSYTTTGTKVTWSGGSLTLTCGATYWITLGGNTGGGFVLDGATPASTSGTATIAGEAAKSGSIWATPSTSTTYSWEVTATPVAGCPTPVSADVNLSGDKKVETFATEIELK
jgi:hypothetical protein